jgi:hypothetical protein
MTISASPISAIPISASSSTPVGTGSGSSGMRRTLIQYYSDYFAKREKEKELEELSKEMVKQASAGVIAEKVHKPIVEREIEEKPDVNELRRRIQLQLQRNYLNKQLAEFTGTQAIIAQVSQLSDDSVGIHNRVLREQSDIEDFLLLASVL